MVAASKSYDELPTSRFAPLPRRGPPPLPSGSRPILAPIIVPRALGKATLIIEVPVGALDDQEIAQISSWLKGRATRIAVERGSALASLASLASRARTRTLRAISAVLVWLLARVDARKRSLPDAAP
ncbi:MAG: hypothetical protein KF819_31670 [Labilithrix sp.]|nr:hypothetical protein [Labilithrix sp.]